MVHARLNRYIDMDPVAIMDALGWLHADGFARVMNAPGFVSMFFGIDLANGKGVGLTFWDSDAAMRISEQIERPVRDEALRLARADRSKGLQDVYDVIYADMKPVGPGPVMGRLLRWEGLEAGTMREGVGRFIADELPAMQALHGYRGVILSSNALLGNTLGVFLWQDRALADVIELERAITARLEARVGSSARPTIFDNYDVAMIPELPPQLVVHG